MWFMTHMICIWLMVTGMVWSVGHIVRGSPGKTAPSCGDPEIEEESMECRSSMFEVLVTLRVVYVLFEVRLEKTLRL